MRFLIYLGQEFQKIIAVRNGDIYGTKLISLPTPRCVIFYNGSTEEPEERILRLSDAFEQKEENPQVELTVRMININFGHNRELMDKCHKLWEYAYFVDQINRGVKRGLSLDTAVHQAVDHCIEEEILRDILVENKAEVVSMLLTEFNERKYKKELRRAGFEEGREDGYAEGLTEGRAVGHAAGHAEGLTQGQQRINQLLRRLKDEGRLDDLMKAIDDEEFQNRLLEDYGL